VLEPAHHEQIVSVEDEIAFWDEIRSVLSSTWAKISVLIDPNG